MPFPEAQFLFGERVENLVADREHALEPARLSRWPFGGDRHHFGIGHPGLGEDDFLTGTDAVQQFGQVRLGIMDIEDRVHRSRVD